MWSSNFTFQEDSFNRAHNKSVIAPVRPSTSSSRNDMICSAPSRPPVVAPRREGHECESTRSPDDRLSRAYDPCNRRPAPSSTCYRGHRPATGPDTSLGRKRRRQSPESMLASAYCPLPFDLVRSNR